MRSSLGCNGIQFLDCDVSINLVISRIYKEGLTERAIILCKLNKSLLESSTSMYIGKKVCIPLRTFVFNKPVGPKKCEKIVCLLCDF